MRMDEASQKVKTGLVLGKFMPPHRGHMHLVAFAQNFVERLTIVVGSLPHEPIAGEMRMAWAQELFPRARVLHLTDELPQYPHEHPDFWKIWEEALRRILPEDPDCVFASEDYGVKLAEILGARFIPVDLQRQAVPISATQIRENPFAHWDYLPDCVRAHYVRRICIVGPECSGKTTLCRALAEKYRTVHVPEFVRTWLLQRGGACEYADMDVIARGQGALEDSLARQTNRILFCDTDLLTTSVWSEKLFQKTPARIEEMLHSRRYDLTFLTDFDVPWQADAVRYFPHAGREFFDNFAARLAAMQRPFVVLRGSLEARLRTACDAVDRLMET